MKGIAEAPGKAIISGEHFVVYGATALAAAIDRKVRVEATRSKKLTIESRIRDEDQLKPIMTLVKSLYKARGAVAEPRVSISISSTLAEGSGLGSSAATMVATAGAIGALEGWELDARSLVETANTGEKLIHGNPSGIDAMTSVTGGVIMFKRGEEPRRIEPRNPVTLLVTFTGKKRNTGKLISKVGEMKETYPSLFASLCKSATLISGLCAEALMKGETASLGGLMTYNHAVLARAGASNRKLDELVDLCLNSGCLGAKLTGAGGGGCVLAIPPVEADQAKAVAGLLAKRGYETFFTTIPAAGARAWTE